MLIFITGCCGFIGGHLSEHLLKQNIQVVGIDNFTDLIYDEYNSQKKETLHVLQFFEDFTFIEGNINDYDDLIGMYKPNFVVHLAAHANVRKSYTNKNEFLQNNLLTTNHLLDQISKLEQKPVFIYASSSSVYGKNKKVPFSEEDELPNICSIYALSKKMCEDLVDFYCKTEQIKAIGLRFFTVYGPRGRPDMAVFQFLKKCYLEEEINMYGDGSMERDFTYIDDIVKGINACFSLDVATYDHEIINLGNNQPISLLGFIHLCGKAVGKEPKIVSKPIPKGDVPITFANTKKAQQLLGFAPNYEFYNGLINTFAYIKKTYL